MMITIACLNKVRRIMNMVLSNFKRVYDPSKNMWINEGMIAYKGCLSFWQFMPAKPTKYGIKVWMAADAKNGYVSNFAVYLGQAENNRRRIRGLGYDVVMKMTAPFLNNYRHIFSTIFSQVQGFLITFLPKTHMHVERCVVIIRTCHLARNTSYGSEKWL